MEFFDLYSAEGHFLNKTMQRGSIFKKGEYAMVVHVWIKVNETQFLIQQRNKKHDPIPYQWATISGLLNAKETPVDAAIRETKEELGLTIDKNSLNKVAHIISSHDAYHTITHVFMVQMDVDEASIQLQLDEVRDYDFKTLEDIRALVDKNHFWNYTKLLNVADYFCYLEEGI